MRPCSVTPVASREARASLYDAVLSPSFGPEELPPREQFLAWTARDELEVLLATDPETGETLGCAVVALRQCAPEVALLAWLAVRPGLRGTGTGGALLGALALAVSRPYAHARKARAQCEVRALAPFDDLPLGRLQFEGYFLD